MQGWKPLSILLVVAALSILTVTGCGGDSASTSADAGSAAETASASNPESAKAGASESGEGEAGNEIFVPRVKSEVVKIGTEGSDSERKAASAVLAGHLKARAAHDWAVQCDSLSALVVRAIGENRRHKGQTCTQALSLEAPYVPQRIFKNTLEGEIDTLRVEGSGAIALWHNADGNDYAMALEKEDGQWKVANLTTTKLRKPEPTGKGKPKSGAEPQKKSPSGSG